MPDLASMSEKLQLAKTDLETQLAQDVTGQLALVNETISLITSMPDFQKVLDNLSKLNLIA